MEKDKDYKILKGKKPAIPPIDPNKQHLHDKHYKYEKLANIKHIDKPKKELTKEDRKNMKKYFYAFVLDATAPYRNKTDTKFISILKIADDSLNPLASENKGTMKLYLFSRKESGLPNINEIGTIIRVHRATTQKYEGKISLYCDVNNFGSWCTFKMKTDSANEKFVPITHSDTSFQFIKEDQGRLEEIRKSSLNCLKNLIQFELTKTIAEKDKKKFDLDFLALILKKKITKDKKNIKIKFCDQNNIGKLIISIIDFTKFSIEQGQVVRIRSVNFDEKGKYFFLKPHSNILKVPEISKTYKNFFLKMKNSENKEIALYLKIYVNYLEEYTLSKPISTPFIKNAIKLNDLLKDNKGYPNGKVYQIKVSSINISPKNVENWITKMKGINFTLECKDIINYDDDHIYTIDFTSERAKSFMPIANKPDSKDKNYIKKLKIIKKMLLKTNCILDLLVIKEEGNLLITDSNLDIKFD